MFAQIINGAVHTEQSRPPKGARRLDTGEWITPLDRQWTLAEGAACGWFPVTETPRPPDTATTTFDRTVQVVDGLPVETWTERDKTQAELDAEAEADNRTVVEAAIDAALATDQDIIDGVQPYLDLASPTQGQAVQQVRVNALAVKALAANQRKIIRALRGDFDGID